MANYAYYETRMAPRMEVAQVWARFLEYAIFGYNGNTSTLYDRFLENLYVHDEHVDEDDEPDEPQSDELLQHADRLRIRYAHATRGMDDMLQRWWNTSVLSTLWHAQGPVSLVMEGVNSEKPILMTPIHDAWLFNPKGLQRNHGRMKKWITQWNLRSTLHYHGRQPRSKNDNWFSNMSDVADGFCSWYNDQQLHVLKPVELAMIACCDPQVSAMPCMEFAARLSPDEQYSVWTQAFAHQHRMMLFALSNLGYRLPNKTDLMQELEANAWIQGCHNAPLNTLNTLSEQYDVLHQQQSQIEHVDAFKP